MLRWMFIVLSHRNNSPQIDMSLYTWFWAMLSHRNDSPQVDMSLYTWFWAMLSHRNDSPQVDMSFYTWFWANQALLLIFIAACLAGKQQILMFIVFDLIPRGIEPITYRTTNWTRMLIITPHYQSLLTKGVSYIRYNTDRNCLFILCKNK